jgi:DNA-binding transcriptional regulator YiaG
MNATATEPQALAIARLRELCASGKARDIRQAARLALDDLASEVGVTRSCVAAWEGGLRRPPKSSGSLTYLALLDELAERYLAPA